jgi:hypothetical protein
MNGTHCTAGMDPEFPNITHFGRRMRMNPGVYCPAAITVRMSRLYFNPLGRLVMISQQSLDPAREIEVKITKWAGTVLNAESTPKYRGHGLIEQRIPLIQRHPARACCFNHKASKPFRRIHCGLVGTLIRQPAR